LISAWQQITSGLSLSWCQIISYPDWQYILISADKPGDTDTNGKVFEISIPAERTDPTYFRKFVDSVTNGFDPIVFGILLGSSLALFGFLWWYSSQRQWVFWALECGFQAHGCIRVLKTVGFCRNAPAGQVCWKVKADPIPFSSGKFRRKGQETSGATSLKVGWGGGTEFPLGKISDQADMGSIPRSQLVLVECSAQC